MSVAKVTSFLCYDLEACFVKKGCTRSDTKILEVAFKSKQKAYQRLVNPLPKYNNAKEVMDSLTSLNQHVENTINFWVKLLIGKKALDTSVSRKTTIQKAESISTLLKRSDVAKKYEDESGMMQALYRNDDDVEKAEVDLRTNDKSFDQIFYTADEAIKDMIQEAKGIDVWVAHNGKSFDEKILRGHSHNFDHVVFVDSLHLLKYLIPDMPSYSQPQLYQQLFKKKYFAHHALEDSVALCKIMDHALQDKCIIKVLQEHSIQKEKQLMTKKTKKYKKVHPESTLYEVKGIGTVSVEKLYKEDIKSKEDLIGLINSCEYDTWCEKYKFIRNHKKIYETYKGFFSTVAVV